MKTLSALSLVMLTVSSLHAQAPASAVAKAEQRLAQLLTPSSKVSDPAFDFAKPPRTPRPFDRPELPLTSPPVAAPAPPRPEGRPVQPRTLPEDPPLVRNFNQPDAPFAVQVPAQPLVRLWGPDVNEPLPLPILGNGVSDRASLGDPSLEASIVAAQAKLQPARTQPVPFQAVNLPDPFEHVPAVRLRAIPLDEAPHPPLTLDTFGRR